MRYTLDTFQSSHFHYFVQVTTILLRVYESGGSGRLSLRNKKRFGVAHLYFRGALLVHIAGDKQGGGAIVLHDLLTWSQAQVRFDWNVIGEHQYVSSQEAELFSRWLSLLELRAIACGVAPGLVNGLEERLAAHLLRQTAPLPAVTMPLQAHKTALSRSSSAWSTVSAPSAIPTATMTVAPARPSLSATDKNSTRKLQHLPITPPLPALQAIPMEFEDTLAEEDIAPSGLRQVTGVMQAVGRAVTRKMASIKLPHRS